jgi:hypothetical protein
MRKAKVPLSDKTPAPRRLKSPDWRYVYVSKLLDEWREPRKEDDSYVRGLFDLMKKIRQAPVDEVEAYKDEHPDVADAMMMFEHGPAYRTDVDTRILAGYSYSEVASVVGHRAEVIEQYVKCFFDVQDNLGNHGYINRWVIEPTLRSAPFSTEAMWKRMAVFGGRKMLEALERCSEHQLQSMFETVFNNLVLSKGIQAANGVTPNARNAVELIGLAKDNINERKKIEALAGPQKEEDGFASQVVSVMLKSFTYGLMTQNSMPADPLRAGTDDAKMLALYGDNPPRFVENQHKGKMGGQ